MKSGFPSDAFHTRSGSTVGAAFAIQWLTSSRDSGPSAMR
jgi:hypothetical protein